MCESFVNAYAHPNTRRLLFDQVIGRTDGNRLCHIPGGTDLIGKIVDVDIVDTFTFSLKGKLATEPEVSRRREGQESLAAVS